MRKNRNSRKPIYFRSKSICLMEILRKIKFPSSTEYFYCKTWFSGIHFHTAFLVVEIANQRQLIQYAWISGKWPFLRYPKLKENKIFWPTYTFRIIIHSRDPKFVPSLSEIVDGCKMYHSCLPGFLLWTNFLID